ncbi:hypothetical protein WN944_021122 [Citrus x changshan-huyou]|uniref:Uncharacterized protein n=1 Tax=Citrus x changshan-huyou TaxID=2935761 RepID=A0AAP0MYQ6_9ROSI
MGDIVMQNGIDCDINYKPEHSAQLTTDLTDGGDEQANCRSILLALHRSKERWGLAREQR